MKTAISQTRLIQKRGHVDALTDELSANQKLTKPLQKVENQQDNTSKRYSDHKLEQLRQLEQQVKQNNNLTNEQKQNVEKILKLFDKMLKRTEMK